jgi:murein DD-endopeptidase MepM/ murein hydrolase activator NlpD
MPILTAVARTGELIARVVGLVAEAIGAVINPIKALFNVGGDTQTAAVSSFFDQMFTGLDKVSGAIDSFNQKWSAMVLNTNLAAVRANMKLAGKSEEEIQAAQDDIRDRYKPQSGLTEEVQLRSLKVPGATLDRIEARDQRLGFGSARALAISKEWADIKQKAYQNEIKSLEQGLTLMNKQREVAEAMSAVAAARRALLARSYELGVQVAASPEAKAAAETRLADVKLRQEKEAIAERRGILQTERELQQRQMLIQQTQIKIQQEQLKIQVAEAEAERERVRTDTQAFLKARGNTSPRSPEWMAMTTQLNKLAAEQTLNNAKVDGSRKALHLAFQAEAQLGTINGLEAQRLGLQEQQLDIQGQTAQYTREQQALMAQISAAEQKITNELTRATNIQNEKKQKLEAQTEEINRQLKLQDQQGRMEKARADLAATRAKAEVQAAQRLEEVQAAQERARNGGGTASVIEAQIAAAAAGVTGMETAAEVQKRLYDARDAQMTREHALQQRQLEVQQMREKSEVRIQELQLRGQQVALAIEKARLVADLGRLGLSQKRDALSPQLAGASSVPGLPGTPTGMTANILPGTKGGPNWNEGVGYGRGRLHAGQDLGTDPNDPVAARMNGVIEQAYAKGFGKAGGAVVIKYQDGSKGTYGHVNPLVAQGQSVSAGQLIARVTPDGNNSHLHYELRNAQGQLNFNPGAAIRAGMAAGGRPAAAAVPASAIRATNLGGGGAAAGVSGGPVTSTANQEQGLQQALQDNTRVQGEVAQALKDFGEYQKTIGNAQSLETENLTEQQLAERAQFEFEQRKALLTAEVMKTSQGQLGLAAGDAVSGSISGSLSGAMQALLNGGDVKQAVSGALAQAGQGLMQATMDALLNPLLAELQKGIFKTVTGVDVEALALQKAGTDLTAAAIELMRAGTVLAGNGGTEAAAMNFASNPFASNPFAIAGKLLGGVGGFSGAMNLDFGIPALTGIPDFSSAFTPGLAGGGTMKYGLDYLVGEKGAEIVRFNKDGGRVYSNRALTQALGVPFQRAPGGGAAVADGDSLGVPFKAAGFAGGIPFLKAGPGGAPGSTGSPGGSAAAMPRSAPIRLSVESQVINGVEYATIEQLREASAAAAQAGRDSAYDGMRNNPSIQRSLGMR